MSEHLLILKNSVQPDGGLSGQLVDHFTTGLLADDPSRVLRVRDLASHAVAHLSSLTLGAILSSAQDHPAQAATARLSNELIEEFERADRVVIGLPVYNFGVPSVFKAYIDHLLRPGVAFRYTDAGPQSLLRDKPVHLITTSGGIYHAHGEELLVPWVRKTLNFVGVHDIQVVYAEGLQTSPEQKALALAQARAELDLVRHALRQGNHAATPRAEAA